MNTGPGKYRVTARWDGEWGEEEASMELLAPTAVAARTAGIQHLPTVPSARVEVEAELVEPHGTDGTRFLVLPRGGWVVVN